MTHYRFPLLCVLLIALAIGAAPAPNAMAAAEVDEPETALCVAADLAGVAADLGPCVRYGSCEVCEVDNLPPGCVVKICPDGEGGKTHEVDCGDPD